jgi:hypothetical protein
MNEKIVYVIILIALAYIISYGNNKNGSSQNYTVPPEYRGTAGLDYLKRNYAPSLSQAQSLCTSQFKGNWIDTSNTIGCYNMKGFSTAYCSIDIVRNLENTCNSIGGSAICSINQASCTV